MTLEIAESRSQRRPGRKPLPNPTAAQRACRLYYQRRKARIPPGKPGRPRHANPSPAALRHREYRARNKLAAETAASKAVAPARAGTRKPRKVASDVKDRPGYQFSLWDYVPTPTQPGVAPNQQRSEATAIFRILPSLLEQVGGRRYPSVALLR